MSATNLPGHEDEDARLDATLRDYFAAQLDGQLGRSAARFRSHLSGGRSGSGPATGGGRRRGPGGWVVGVVGGALAASIAALWAGPSLRVNPPDVPGAAVTAAALGGGAADGAMDLRMEELTLCSQTRDGGTVLLDERTAARRLIRRELKQTRWVDPKTGASLEKFEPRQAVMLIRLDTY